MYTIYSAYQHVKQTIVKVYDEHEATAIAHEIMEYITGLNKLERLTQKELLLSELQNTKLEDATNQLSTGKPLQYIIGSSWFLGHQYLVNRDVLIPRPETEELVLLITEEWKMQPNISILDIGTGSGCIPIAIKHQIPSANITSIDISEPALAVANNNAKRLNAEINFINIDILNPESQRTLDQYDIIVSNPPYIPTAYKKEMSRNVKDFEPEIALFVPNNDPLLFYRRIAELGKSNLKPSGTIYCELHADHALETKKLFEDMGYLHVLVKKDIYGKPRILKVNSIEIG